jgi:hypothetical protein
MGRCRDRASKVEGVVLDGRRRVAAAENVSVQPLKTRSGRYISFWTFQHLVEGKHYLMKLARGRRQIAFVVVSAPESAPEALGHIRVTGVIET